MEMDIVTAISTLVGVVIGAGATAAGARAGMRRTWNLDQLKESRSFYTEIIVAANAQLILLSNLSNQVIAEFKRRLAAALVEDPSTTKFDFHHEFPQHQVEQLREATASWRTVFAKLSIYAEPDVGEVIVELDTIRARILEELNNGRPDNALAEIREFEAALAKLHRVFHRLSVKHNLLILDAVHPWRGRRKMRKYLNNQLKEGMEAGASASAP